jgi:hypothetical protein
MPPNSDGSLSHLQQKPMRGCVSVVMHVLYNKPDLLSNLIINTRKETFMWISKITYDLVAARVNLPEFVDIVRPLIWENRVEVEKKYKERSAPVLTLDWDRILSSYDLTATTERLWSTKSVAQEHVDFAVLQADYITGVVEEQV